MTSARTESKVAPFPLLYELKLLVMRSHLYWDSDHHASPARPLLAKNAIATNSSQPPSIEILEVPRASKTLLKCNIQFMPKVHPVSQKCLYLCCLLHFLDRVHQTLKSALCEVTQGSHRVSRMFTASLTTNWSGSERSSPASLSDGL